MNDHRTTRCVLLLGMGLTLGGETTLSAQPEPDDPTGFDPVINADLADETSPFHEEERGTLAAVLEHVAETPVETVREDARKWLRLRRREREDLADDDRRALNVLADLVEHSERYRGQPMVLWGRLVSHGTVDLPATDDDEARVVQRLEVAAHDDADRPFVVLLPEAAPAPKDAGVPVVLSGYFLKMGLPDESSAPILVSGRVTALRDRLDAELMESVEDETADRPEERDAYLTAIAHARMMDVEHLHDVARAYRNQRVEETGFRHAPEKFPTYVDLFRHVDWDHYQGRPVTLSGHVWSVSKVPVGRTSEEYGFETLYEILLYDRDSQTIPALVICTEIPEGMPATGHLEEALDGTSVTGFFFKMRTYLDQEEKGRKVPVIIARSIEWNPPESTIAAPEPWVYAAVVGAALVLIGAVWWLGGGRPGRATATEDGEEPTFDGIDV